jgi:putative oxidoreductase
MDVNIGMLVLRVVVGLLFVGHGTQKLFGWFGGHGVRGTGGFFENLGYRPGRHHAVAAGIGEAGGGALLALGLLMPLAALAIIGVMVNAIGAVHGPNGVWVSDGGFEYPLVLIAAVFAMTAVGPGHWALDSLLPLPLRGFGWAFGALVLGVIIGAGVLASRRPELPAEVAATAEAEHRRAA